MVLNQSETVKFEYVHHFHTQLNIILVIHMLVYCALHNHCSFLSIVTKASGREDFIWLRGRPAEEPDPDPGTNDKREDVGEHNRVEELLPPLSLLPEQREAIGARLGACAGKLPSLGRRDVRPGRKDNSLILNKQCRCTVSSSPR